MITHTKMVGKKGEILIVPLLNDVKQLRGLFKKEGYTHERDIDEVLFKLIAGL